MTQKSILFIVVVCRSLKFSRKKIDEKFDFPLQQFFGCIRRKKTKKNFVDLEILICWLNMREILKYKKSLVIRKWKKNKLFISFFLMILL
jgi:hypothetical protein